MARYLVARHFRKGAAKCTAWAVRGTEVKLLHRVLSQSCWCVNQLICSWQLLAWRHNGSPELVSGPEVAKMALSAKNTFFFRVCNFVCFFRLFSLYDECFFLR